MLALFRSGMAVEEIARRQERSPRAILIRLGAMLERSPDHPDYIRIDVHELREHVVEGAHQAFRQQQRSREITSLSPNPVIGGQKDRITEMEKKILDAITEMRTDIRKLRAQVRHYSHDTKPPHKTPHKTSPDI